METNVTKRLKNKSFNRMSSALGCVFFVVLNCIMDLVVKVISGAGAGNLFVAILVSFLVEAVFLVAALAVSGIQRVEFFEATKMNKRPGVRSVLIGVIISLITLFSFTNLTNAFVLFMQNLGYHSQTSQIVIPNIQTYLLYVFLLCLCPACFEESLFRGVILNGLKGYGKHVAVLVSAAVFTLMHGGPDQTIHQFLLGLVLGYAYLASGSFWVPFTIHFTNNFLAVTSIFLQGSQARVSVSLSNFTPWVSVLMVFVSGVLAAAIGAYLIKLLIGRLAALRKEINLKSAAKAQAEESKPAATVTQLMDESKRQKRETTLCVVFYAISITYLVINWILACIVGFGG